MPRLPIPLRLFLRPRISPGLPCDCRRASTSQAEEQEVARAQELPAEMLAQTGTVVGDRVPEDHVARAMEQTGLALPGAVVEEAVGRSGSIGGGRSSQGPVQ